MRLTLVALFIMLLGVSLGSFANDDDEKKQIPLFTFRSSELPIKVDDFDTVRITPRALHVPNSDIIYMLQHTFTNASGKKDVVVVDQNNQQHTHKLIDHQPDSEPVKCPLCKLQQ